MIKRITVYAWMSVYLAMFYAIIVAVSAPFVTRLLFVYSHRLHSIEDMLVLMVFMALIFLGLAWIFYSLMYCYVFSPLRIIGSKLVVPKTNHNGFPALMAWDRIVVDIAAIKKIKQYPEHQSDVITIIYQGGNVQFNAMFYGHENINLFIESLWGCNDQIEINDRNL